MQGLIKLILAGGLLVLSALVAFSQGGSKPESARGVAAGNPVKYSAAFAEVLLLRAELEAEIESLIVEYTDEHPRIKEARYQLTLIQRDTERLLSVKPAESGKLTLSLGKLLVRRIGLETELWLLRSKYKDDHPDVKRAKKKVEIFENAIKEILD